MPQEEKIEFERPLPLKEAGAALGFSYYTMRGKLLRGEIPFLRIGRSIRIPVSVVRQILSDAYVPAKVKP
jgi:excisionase family DNA binding protein